MARDYDAIIAEHYRQVAAADGLSPSSTMADEIIRGTETDAILTFVQAAARSDHRLLIADVGCGNGVTLGVLGPRFPDHDFLGLELSDDLRALAGQRVASADLGNVTVAKGDIRQPGFTGERPLDVVICQRVLINLLDEDDQKAALRNIVDAVTPGGSLLFIEAFQSGLDRLNEARAEFELRPIPPAHHNIYLEDNFFDRAGLQRFDHLDWLIPPNVLSTHYYVSRVLYPTLLDGKPLKRNAHFIMMMSKALPQAVGDFAPVRILAFRKA